MKSRKNFLFIISIVLYLNNLKAFAYESDIAVKNDDGVTIYYNYINDGKELEVAAYSYSGRIAIPEDVTYMNNTRKVTSIANQAFWASRVTSVSIPNSVTYIGSEAFRYCYQLTSVTMGDNVNRINMFAFCDCEQLVSINIPNSLTIIEKCAFSGCKSLKEITIPNSITTISDGAFQTCSSLTDLSIPKSVTSIDGNAFWGCGNLNTITVDKDNPNYDSRDNSNCIIETETNKIISGCKNTKIPNSVTSIGKAAFGGFNFDSFIIPNNVTSIEGLAFLSCDISEVISEIDNPFSISDRAFTNNTLLNAILYVPVGSIEKYKEADGWKLFSSIKEGIPSSISNIINFDNKEFKIYSLDGKFTNNLQKGINILKKKNGKTKKVVVNY